MDPDDTEFDQPEMLPDRIEPGSPTAENAAAVLLGVLSMLAVVLHLVGLL